MRLITPSILPTTHVGSLDFIRDRNFTLSLAFSSLVDSADELKPSSNPRRLASGRSYTEIAEARGNSAVTVRNTLYRIQEKLGVGRKQELVIWAVRNGLVDGVVVGNNSPPEPEAQ